MKIETITVIGSGVMGSGIAAHMVNAGYRKVFLLDILPPKLTGEQIGKGYTLENKHIRNITGRINLNKLIKSKPPQFGLSGFPDYITIGNIEDDFERCVSSSDWIIEVIPEIAHIKNETFKRIDTYRKKDSIVSSNTSGISIEKMTAGCSDTLCEHFLITHFFNPVRYMKLLEIVKSDKTKKEVIDTITAIGQHRLGKGIVYSYDVPAFVGNRIGVFNIMFLMSLISEYGIEPINAVFDKKLGYGGKPFSTCDLVGLDVLGHVVKNIYDNTRDEFHDVFKLPDFFSKMIESGKFGRKTGAGFFKRERVKGKNIDYVIDPVNGTYIPRKKPQFQSLAKAKAAKTLQEAILIMYNSKDLGGEIFQRTVDAMVRYSFARAPEISPEGIEGIDKAICWGFNQKQGPGQVCDIIGINTIVKNIEKKGPVPKLLSELYNTGKNRVYIREDHKDLVFDRKDIFREIIRPEEYSSFHEIAKSRKPVFEVNKGARLFDIGDDVLAAEMLSRNGTINMEVIDALSRALEKAEKDARGLVIGNDLDHFSYGADLDMLLGYALRGKREMVETVIKEFQMLNHRLKFSKVPVVVVKKGMALGGGCELGYGAHIRAAHDMYTGLVEFGVGLIPGGGGVKETLVKKYNKYREKEKWKPLDYIRETFEQIAYIKVSVSAHDAKKLGYISPGDAISMNSDFLLHDAKEDVIRLSKDYKPPEETKVYLPGSDIKATLYTAIDLAVRGRMLPPMKVPGFIRKHFELVAKTFAHVVSGGDILYPGKEFSELELLELEREAFLNLTTELSLTQKFSWLQIAASTLKKKPFSWALGSIKSSYKRKKGRK